MLLSIRHRLWMTILIITFGIGAVKGQDSLRLTLQDVRRMALENNTTVRNSTIDLEIAKKKVWETTAIGLPHLDSKAAYQFLLKVPSIPADLMGGKPGEVLELGVKNNITFDVTVSQLIFNGSYLVGLKAMKTLYEQTNQSLEKVVQDVNENVTNTYYMILVAEESKKNLSKNLENVNKTKFEIGEMNKQGFVEKTDVDQLELTANTLMSAINQVESNLDLAYRLLKIQTGIDNDTKICLYNSIQSNEPFLVACNNLIHINFDIERNVDYKIMKTSTDLAKLDYKNTITSYMPIVTGFLNHQEKLNKPFFDFTPKDIIGVNFSLPIFSSGQRMAAVSQKKLNLDKVANSTALVSKNILMQADQFQTDLKIKLEKYQIQKKSLTISDEIYQRTLTKYKNGVSSSMDLMSSQNQYLNNLTNYYQSIYDLAVAKSKLEKLYNINQNIEK